MVLYAKAFYFLYYGVSCRGYAGIPGNLQNIVGILGCLFFNPVLMIHHAINNNPFIIPNPLLVFVCGFAWGCFLVWLASKLIKMIRKTTQNLGGNTEGKPHK
jgi:hypothetical protein